MARSTTWRCGRLTPVVTALGPATGTTAGSGAPLVNRYDDNGNGTIEKSEVIAAINDYLFGEGDEAISKAEVIELINLYLFGPS